MKKTTQRSSHRRARLALLAGAVLTAALAVAAALFFRAGDPPSDATNAIQEAPVSAENGNETNHAAGAPSGEPQHELAQGTDAEKVKTWIDSFNQAEAQYELTQDPNEIARLQRLGQELKQELASFDPSTRIAIHMQILYGNAGRPSNPKILELLERDARTFIEEGADDEEIGGRLFVRLDMYKLRSTKELDSIYQHMLNEKQGIVETDGWKYDPNQTEKQNRIKEYLFEHTGLPYIPEGEKTPRGVIEILVEGMDDLTAAKYLIQERDVFPEAEGELWVGPIESEYAAEYAERVLAGDPSSRDALLVKLFSGTDLIETARLLIEHHPTDDGAVVFASGKLYKEYPEEAIAAISRILPEDSLHSNSRFHMLLGNAYERLDMLYEAAEQFQIAFAAGRWAGDYRFSLLERGERALPSIWEERAAAAAEAAKQTPQPAEASAPQRQPDAPASPNAPRGMEPPPPPPNLEAEMFAAYADFAKAYQSAFKMEYALSEATPEGYMNALLGMARAFAKAGDAQRAQDAYNAVRKRHSREEVEQVFRRFDEQERLKRQPPSDEENDDSGEDE